jgi:hypothetical protein
MLNEKTKEFRNKLIELDREELLEIIKDQNPEYIKQINRIEYVFANKLKHLTWKDGTPIDGREVTKKELALLIDEPFVPDQELSDLGLSIIQQRELHVAKDVVTWSKNFLGVEPRVYQTLILRHPSLRKVLRAGRRLGKTVSMSLLLLHYSYTNKNAKSIVIAPMKAQVEVIYKEVLKFASNSEIVKQSITRNVTSPQFVIEFSNGSQISFFTSGMRSGGKSDVVRGQEAHLIVLDELDYMHPDDLIAVMAMLQKTDENQPDKVLIGASTPTGKREIFYSWCTDIDNTGLFKEFWFPSYCNPMMTNETERELRLQYTSEMAYRHEVEADWGEDAEGVYPRRFIDASFIEPSWDYRAQREEQKAKYVLGVDWDKYGAGVNIVVLEINEQASRHEYSGRVRLAYREETIKEEYTLTKAVDRIIQLNDIFVPEHIYVDRGFGEVQIELLHKYGVENRLSGLATKVKGVSSAETVEIRDPFTQQKMKKEIKPFMVDNVRQMLEKGEIIFPAQDSELYKQLSAYVVARRTASGRPVYEASGTAQDHAHDALMLACHAINENYGELMKSRSSTKTIAIGNEAFLPTFTLSGNSSERSSEQEIIEDKWGSAGSAPVMFRRSMSYTGKRGNRQFRRKSF